MIPTYQQLLGALRELVDPISAGLLCGSEGFTCEYCDGYWPHNKASFQHEDGCPVQVARDLIISYDLAAISGVDE